MTYVHAEQPARRAATIAAVGALHLAAFYAVVAGLSVGFIPKGDPPPISATNTPLDPVPPSPRPEREHRRMDHPLTDPLPQPSREPMVLPTATFPLDPPRPFGDPTGSGLDPVPLPRPTTPAFTPKAARPLSAPEGWVGEVDYPTTELRLGHAGKVGFRLSIGSEGQVTACTIIASSGYARLDETTCRLLARRARFDPARNAQGLPVAGEFASAVRWQIPD